MRRIAVVFLGRKGGTSRYAAELASGLFKAGYHVLSVASEYSQYKALWPDDTAFVPTYQNMLQALFFLFSGRWFRPVSAVRRFRPEAIIYPGLFPLMPLMDLLMGRAKRIIAVHDVQLHPGQDDLFRRLLNLWSFARAHVIVVLSESQQDALPRLFRRKAVVIPHPVFSVDVQRRKHRVPTVLFIGRITRYKGLDTLCQAVELLRKRMGQLRLVVAGSGDVSGYDLRGAVLINKWLSDQEMADLLSAAWVVALPYTQATQSGVAALARGAGVPTVGSRVGGLAQQLDLAVQPGDPDALADALFRAMTGRVKPSKGPGWQDVIKTYQEVLK